VLTFWLYVWQLDPGPTYDEHLVLALKKLGVTHYVRNITHLFTTLHLFIILLPSVWFEHPGHTYGGFVPSFSELGMTQGYGLPIGFQFFGTLGSEANIIWATPPRNILGQAQAPDKIDRHRRCRRLQGRAGGGCHRMDSGGKSRVLQVGKVARASKAFWLRRKQGRADLWSIIEGKAVEATQGP
jgi:hypothetical protein